MCQSQGGVERCWKAVVNGFQARNPAWMTCLSFIVWMHRDIYIYDVESCIFFTWNQHHIQDQENNIKNYLTSSDPHRDKLFCRSFWHLIWKYIYGIYFLTFASGILSDILFWHPIWHSFWHLFWHSLWHGHWDLELAVEVWQRPLRPGSAHWAPELARQCPQSSGAGSCDPRPNKEGRNEGRKEKVPLIKSRDRHLAGWELTSRIKQIAKQIDRHEAKKKHIAPQRLAYSCCAIADFVSLETQGSQICTFPWKSILCKKRQERDKTKKQNLDSEHSAESPSFLLCVCLFIVVCLLDLLVCLSFFCFYSSNECHISSRMLKIPAGCEQARHPFHCIWSNAVIWYIIHVRSASPRLSPRGPRPAISAIS